MTDGDGRPVAGAGCFPLSASAQPSKDEFDDFLGDVVGQTEVGAGDCDEADDDSGCLEDLAAVGPLYALELCPAGANEADGAVSAAQRRAGGTLGLTATTAASAPATGDPVAGAAG